MIFIYLKGDSGGPLTIGDGQEVIDTINFIYKQFFHIIHLFNKFIFANRSLVLYHMEQPFAQWESLT